MSEPEVRDVLRLYFDAIVLAEPAQLALWQSAELTLTQLGALSKLRGGPLPAGKLAEQLGISPASLTRVLDRLEARGLLRRTPDPHDRRNRIVALTPEGRVLVVRCRDGIRAMEDELLAGLAPDERDALRRLLTRAAEELDV